MANFAVLGFGVVGSGVVELFYKNKKHIEEKAGTEMEVKKILDLRDFPDSPYRDKLTTNMDDILNDDSITVVAECMGGVEPAYTYVKACLERGKSVSSSNKELVAKKGAELLACAAAHNCNFFFEASVGGAIPIIRPLHKCLAANDIHEISGILNGTTNFILAKMISDNMSFDDALKLAQENGYAEKDPTADVEGFDACRKICILSSLVFGKHVYPESVYTKGITSLTLEDVELAKLLGGAVKLIASVKRLEDGRILPSVMPTVVPFHNMLSHVDDVFNAVMVNGDGIDKAMFYGRGAGKLPTASAVLGDVIDEIKHERTVFSQMWADAADQSFVAPIGERSSRMFVKISKAEPEKITQALSEFFRSQNIALKAKVQLAGMHNDGCIAFFTPAPLTMHQADQLAAALSADEIHVCAMLPVLD
ncbi:MAG: homoserine dehydrogenase [Ruminococcus sp.]|nr:homoserine dehydrogenase [Ruminococcus sp.]MBQ8906764.1 homoserine dehydrogenase [Ruminococcus sp.]